MAGQPAAHQDVPLEAVPYETIATWPVGSFLENIAILPDGDFVVSIHNQQELQRVNSVGEHRNWVSMPASPAGIIVADDAVFVVGGTPGEGPHHLYRIALTGDVQDCGPVPGSVFLNGFTPGPHGTGYAVDSIMGAVIAIDLDGGSSEVVLEDVRLQKVSDEPMLPGVNGIKAGDGALYLTNTDRALVLKAPLDSDGKPRGTIDTIAEHLRGDDLAVGTDGDLFITTHRHNTLIQLAPDGRRIAIAGPEQGMAGCTACVFGTAPDGSTSLFVTATGGIGMPWNGVLQEAKLVRLDVATTGRPVDFFDAAASQ